MKIRYNKNLVKNQKISIHDNEYKTNIKIEQHSLEESCCKPMYDLLNFGYGMNLKIEETANENLILEPTLFIYDSEYYAYLSNIKFCPFCGDKIELIEVKNNVNKK